MTRETKIGLLVGLAFIIVIGILLSEHVSSTNEPQQAPLNTAGGNVRDGVLTPGATDDGPPISIAGAPVETPASRCRPTSIFIPRPRRSPMSRPAAAPRSAAAQCPMAPSPPVSTAASRLQPGASTPAGLLQQHPDDLVASTRMVQPRQKVPGPARRRHQGRRPSLRRRRPRPTSPSPATASLGLPPGSWAATPGQIATCSCEPTRRSRTTAMSWSSAGPMWFPRPSPMLVAATNGPPPASRNNSGRTVRRRRPRRPTGIYAALVHGQGRR